MLQETLLKTLLIDSFIENIVYIKEFLYNSCVNFVYFPISSLYNQTLNAYSFSKDINSFVSFP